MNHVLFRSIAEPVRSGLDWSGRWNGPDNGLIYCWERGREMRESDPILAERAVHGELVTLPWKGGTEGIDEPIDGMKPKTQKRYGTLNYLATWQGLRGEDLQIEVFAERPIVCSRRKREVIFRRLPPSK
jgi:hypothetical protein